MKEKDNLLGRKFVFFLIWPFGAFLHSLRTPQLHSSRIIFYLWFIVFGLCFLPVNEEADSYQYAQEFAMSKNMSVNSYESEVGKFFTNRYDTGVKDLYVLTNIFVVSRVTNNVHVLFMVFAMVFGFFYVKSIKYSVGSEKSSRNDWIFYILFGWLCMSNPIFNINGVRFWTAAWMGVYIMFRYLINMDYKVLFLLPLLYFVHSSFIVFIAIFFVYLFVGRYHKAWNVIFVISLFFSGLSFLPMISDYVMDYLPHNLQFMLQYYSSEEYMSNKAEKMETLSGLAQFFLNLPKIARNLIVIICLLNREKIVKDKSTGRVLEFTIVLLSLTNIISTIPSAGRFLSMVIPFLVYILISSYQFSKQYKWVIYSIPIMYFYSLYIWLLNMMWATSLSIYFTPLPVHIIRYLLI